MTVQRVTCANCGAERPQEIAGDTEREPCPECGASGVSIEIALASELNLSSSVSWTAQSANSAPARRDALSAAIDDVEAAILAGQAGAAQGATKRALEAIHELDDGRRNRSEWAENGWTSAETELWRAHVGARNAGHHSSASIVALHGGTKTDDRLTWDLPASAVAGLHSAAQQKAYNARLAAQQVLPGLRQVAALLRRSTI